MRWQRAAKQVAGCSKYEIVQMVGNVRREETHPRAQRAQSSRSVMTAAAAA